jgi:hypothetical protein
MCGKEHPLVTYYGGVCPLCEVRSGVEQIQETLGMSNTLCIGLAAQLLGTEDPDAEILLSPTDMAELASKYGVEVEPVESDDPDNHERLMQVKLKARPPRVQEH